MSIRKMKTTLSRYFRLARTRRDVVARINALPWVMPGAGGKVRGLKLGITLHGLGVTAATLVLQDRD